MEAARRATSHEPRMHSRSMPIYWSMSHHQLTLPLPVQKISNSRHIRGVSRRVKTMTRNSKMTASLAFIAYVQYTNSVRRAASATELKVASASVRGRSNSLRTRLRPPAGPRQAQHISGPQTPSLPSNRRKPSKTGTT